MIDNRCNFQVLSKKNIYSWIIQVNLIIFVKVNHFSVLRHFDVVKKKKKKIVTGNYYKNVSIIKAIHEKDCIKFQILLSKIINFMK